MRSSLLSTMRANRSPWRTLADFGIVVKSVSLDPETRTLNFDDYKAKLG